jgi:hypothetical protein
MLLTARRAAPAAVLIACALTAGTAHAQGSPQPPLTTKPPVPLSAQATPVATPARPELARTGSDAGITALAGLSLLGMGLSLRRLADGAV